MKNRQVGIIIIGIGLLIGFMIYSFNKAMASIVNEACTHGPECAMWGTINFQTRTSLGIMILIIIIGVYFTFSDKIKKTPDHQLELKEVKKPTNLSKDEEEVYEKIREADGTIFQSELAEKTGLNKVKITRILDKLEGKKIIERKRRGMTNVVILK